MRLAVGLFDMAAASNRPMRLLRPVRTFSTRSALVPTPLPLSCAKCSGSVGRRQRVFQVQQARLSTSAFRRSPKPERESHPPAPASAPSSSTPPPAPSPEKDSELHESPYTLPNALTLARIAACPFLAYTIVKGEFEWATGILVVGGFTDWLDGYLARKWNQKSVLGSILDPMADKTLMTTLVVTLTYQGLVPLPLAIIIFGRDFALSMWAFYLRFSSLPPPRTLKRYFDPSMPSAEVQPTQISKVNTALQLLLMGVTTVSPLLTIPIGTALQALQWTVAGTTIWSGLSYVRQAGFKVLKQPRKRSQ